MGKIVPILFLVLAVILGACGEEAEPTGEPAPTPTSTPYPTLPEIIADGDGCTYSGPTELSTGTHSFVVKDLSDQTVNSLHIHRITDGHTYQDILELGDYFNESWLDDAPKILGILEPWHAELDGQVYNFVLDAEGDYSLLLTYNYPVRFRPCSPLQVVAADE